MSRDARELRALENDRDIIFNMIDDFADKWDLEEAIGFLIHMLRELNAKRVFPKKEIIIKKGNYPLTTGKTN